MNPKVFFSLFLTFSLFACQDTDLANNCYQDENRKVCLIPNDKYFSLINIPQPKDTNTWDLDYPVYKFLYNDISNNGEMNILVGLIKPTRFDSLPRKRLFVYKFYEEEIRPLWLGSRLGMPLEDFFVEEKDGENYLKTIEREKDGSLAMALYKWDSFGFEFIEYLKRNITDTELIGKYETP